MIRRVAVALVAAAFAAGCASASTDDDDGASAATETPGESSTSSTVQPESLTTIPTEGVPEPAPVAPPPPKPVPVPRPTGISAADLCDAAALIEPSPAVDTDLLPETSGLGYSRTESDLLYAHNDSGNFPRLFGIGAESTIDFVWSIDAGLLDWEDMAAAGGMLYLGDIGDNLHLRPTVRILRLPEPDGSDATLAEPEVFAFTYVDQRFDAETLIVEPDGSEAVILTKGLDAPVNIFVVPLDDEPPARPLRLESIGALRIGLITGGDITADGMVVGVRQYDRILLWDRVPGESIAETILSDTWCEAPSAEERQGEAFAFHPDGRGYTTMSEGESAVRNDFRLPDA